MSISISSSYNSERSKQISSCYYNYYCNLLLLLFLFAITSHNHHHTNAFITTTNHRTSWRTTKPLYNNNPLIDPYAVLDIPVGTTDKKVIKRAYKRGAMKFHPDVNSDPGASDKFIQICEAYEMLTTAGKTSNRGTDVNSRGASSSSYKWEPPHRRSSSYNSAKSGSSSSYTSGTSSTDWKDYIPNGSQYNNDDDQYDTNGDSFGAIFRDLFVSAAVSSSKKGGGGILEDLISFLEQTGNVAANPDDKTSFDFELEELLNNGSLDDVRAELEDVELLIKQLEKKKQNVMLEIANTRNEIATGNLTLRKEEELSETLAGLEAREKVVEGYLSKARKRLVRVQERFMVLRRTSSSSSSSQTSSSSGGSSSPSGYENTNSAGFKSNRSTSSTPSNYSSTSPSSSYANESFGSGGRRRGSSRSSRRRYQNDTEATSTNDFSSGTTSTPSSSAPRYNTNNGTPSSSSSTPSPPSPADKASALRSLENAVTPPHRRGVSATEQYKEKKRLSKLKVDEEFEKLKKDLGL